MFVILCYDIGIKRNSKVKKITRAYLRPIQKSVCEGFITESKLKKLCSQLKYAIDPEEDSVIIYRFSSESNCEKMSIGQLLSNDDYIL